MSETKVDDMLLEMIEPKIEEINRKFSNNGTLTQDDINTLLLKSQYNHINHLDQKLNEVTESVVKLEQKFVNLEQKFVNLEQKFVNLEQKVTSEIKLLEQKMETTINDALNKNMTKLIMIMGAFIALFKIIDKF